MSDTPIPTTTAPTDRAEFWRETVAAFERSGLSARAFCSARGVHEKRFFTWRRKLGLSPVARPAPASDAPPRAFVPVRVVPEATAEIALSGGVVLRVPLAADAGQVARLVAALRGVAC